MNGTTTSSGDNRQPILYRIAPGLGVLATYQREWLTHDLIAGAVGGRRGPANRDRLCRDYRARSGGRTLHGHSRDGGLCDVRHVPPLDRESGRRHLRDDRGHVGAAGGRQSRNSCFAFCRSGRYDGVVLHCGELAAAWVFWPTFFRDPSSSAFSTAWPSASFWGRSARYSGSLWRRTGLFPASSSSYARCPRRTCRHWRLGF